MEGDFIKEGLSPKRKLNNDWHYDAEFYKLLMWDTYKLNNKFQLNKITFAIIWFSF